MASTFQKFQLLLLSLLVLHEMMAMVGEAALCESPSRLFGGACFSSHNCGTICETEGFVNGRCKFFKCICSKDCNIGGGGGHGGGGAGGGGGSDGPPSDGPPGGGAGGGGDGPPSDGPPDGGDGGDGPPSDGPPNGGDNPPDGGEGPPDDGSPPPSDSLRNMHIFI